jgi:hypothetical protein
MLHVDLRPRTRAAIARVSWSRDRRSWRRRPSTYRLRHGFPEQIHVRVVLQSFPARARFTEISASWPRDSTPARYGRSRRRERHLRMMSTGLPTRSVRHANFDGEVVPRPKPPFSPPNPSTPSQPLSIELSPPLRYTGTRLRPGDQGLPGPFTRLLRAAPEYHQYIKGLMMSYTFDQIANIIEETCDIPRDTIKP